MSVPHFPLVNTRFVFSNLRLACFCFASLVFFTLSTLLMHVVQADLSPRDDALSYYMNGELAEVRHERG